MITQSVVDALASVFSWMLSLLPQSDGTAPVPDSATGLVGWLADVNSLIPIDAVIAAALFLLAFLVPMVAFRLVVMARHILLP